MKKERKIVEIDYYFTEDGRSFMSESDAKQHEKDLKDYKIQKEFHRKSGDFCIHIFDLELDEWYMISNQEQLEYVKTKYRNHYLNDYDGNYSGLLIGDWVCVLPERNDDKGNIYTMNYVLEKMKNFVYDAESKTVDGRY